MKDKQRAEFTVLERAYLEQIKSDFAEGSLALRVTTITRMDELIDQLNAENAALRQQVAALQRRANSLQSDLSDAMAEDRARHNSYEPPWGDRPHHE